MDSHLDNNVNNINEKNNEINSPSKPSDLLSKVNEILSESLDAKSGIIPSNEEFNPYSDIGSEMSNRMDDEEANLMIKEIIKKRNKKKMEMTFLTQKRLPKSKSFYIHKRARRKKVFENNNQEENDCPYQTTFKYYDELIKLNITYKFHAESKKYLYYSCSRRPTCHGSCKIDKVFHKMEINNRCNPEIEHDILSYEEFLDLYDKGEFDKIDFNIIKHQKMYVAVTFKKNLVTENMQLIEKFRKDTGKNINLRSHDISVIKSRVADIFNDLTVEQIIEKINSDSDLNLTIKSFDINYQLEEFDNVFKKNYMCNKKGRIIIFFSKDQIVHLNNDNIKEFFFDTTYRIIHKKFLKYKLIILSGFDISDPLHHVILLDANIRSLLENEEPHEDVYLYVFNKPKDSSLSAGAIDGIIFGCLAFVGLIVFLIIFILPKLINKSVSSSEESDKSLDDEIESKPKDTKEINESNDPKEINESNDPKEINESNDPKESNESNDPKEINESNDPKETNESNDPKETNESNDPKESNESNDPKESNESNDPKEINEA